MREIKIPSGYKQTEVGVIPEDWEIRKIGSLATIQRGASPRPIDSPIWFESNSNVGWLRISDVSKTNKYLTKTTQNLSKLGIANSRFVESGNLVMSICATVGKPIITCKDLCIHDGFVLFRGLQTDQDYMYYVLQKLEPEWSNKGQTGSQMNLNTSLINSTPIGMPKRLDEQIAIANTLTDTDNLIQSLKKLIAKKEAIKTGTMQQLLTGKTRLPEFATREDGSVKGFKQTELGKIPEDWDYKTLSEITESKGLVRGPFGGALKKDSFVRSGFKVYEQRNAIYRTTCIGRYYISKDKFSELQRFAVKPNDFIVSCSGTIGRIYKIPEGAPEGIINQALLKITLDNNTDDNFFFQVFNSVEFQESIIDSTQGGAMKNLIGMSEFKKSIMLMPPKKEQTAIANILSDMDAEIQALQERLEKTKEIKQGMMQQLLTGKVRLLSPDQTDNKASLVDSGTTV